MKFWKKLLTASVACSALFITTADPAQAAYSLNPEVKMATPSLLTASQIGVLEYTNESPVFKALADKDAIVVMSFGTTYKENRVKTIEATIDEIQAAHPKVKVVPAFTSHIIIDRIQKNEGLHYPTPEEALDHLKAEGYTRIALVSLDVIPGMEYEYQRTVFHTYKEKFKKMTFSTPLIYWQGQEEQPDDVEDFINALLTEVKKPAKNSAVLVMAHGTPHTSNAYYSVIQAKLREMHHNNVYIYTVEGWPNLETVIPKLKARKIKNITLVPMMMVAGDHANNDMAGDEDDSHKSILTKAGFNVTADLRGLGENEAIRALYVKHANEAWDKLQER